MSVFLNLSMMSGVETLQAFDEGHLTLELPLSSFKLGHAAEKHYMLSRPAPTMSRNGIFAITLAALLLCIGCGATGDDEPADAAPDAQVIDASPPDAHIDACASGCGGCGEPGRSCCLGTAPDPAMYCLGEGVACDQLSNVCVDLTP